MAQVPQFRLKCNGTPILTWTPASYGTVAGNFGGTRAAGSAIRPFLHSPGGPAVYSLEMLASDGDIAGERGSVFYRSLLVQGVRR